MAAFNDPRGHGCAAGGSRCALGPADQLVAAPPQSDSRLQRA